MRNGSRQARRIRMASRSRRTRRRGRKVWSQAVRKTTRIDATQTAAQAIAAAKRPPPDGACAKAAVGGGYRLAPRSGALDSRGTPENQRRSAGFGRQARAAGPHHARRTTGQIAYAGGQGIACVVVSSLAGRNTRSQSGYLARRGTSEPAALLGPVAG